MNDGLTATSERTKSDPSLQREAIAHACAMVAQYEHAAATDPTARAHAEAWRRRLTTIVNTAKDQQ